MHTFIIKPIAHFPAVSADAIKCMTAIDPITVGVKLSAIMIANIYRCFDMFHGF